MKLPLFIARKYFFSTRKRNFINVISIFSMFGVAIFTAALIIALSVFNGLENLIHTLYGAFDPELKITAVKGRSFEVTDSFIAQIDSLQGVEVVTEVIEDYAYVKYRNNNMVVTIKGVSDNFVKQGRMDTVMVDGDLTLQKGDVNYAIIGRGVQYALSIMLENNLYPLQVFYIKDIKAGVLNPSKLYNQKNILPGGIFSIEKNIDENYILVPLRFAQELLSYENKRTSLEIKVSQGNDISNVQFKLKSVLGDDFNVENDQEQHADLYKLLKLEKLFVFITLSFIIAIGSINIFFSLFMLVIDKKRDISILYAMGATDKIIRSIFLTEGFIISISGAAIGLMMGGLICWAQQTFGFVSMGMESSILDYYPVKIQFMDFVYTSLSIIVITILISYRPAILATKYKSAITL